MRPQASLKEVRHLEEKSSRGFRFLRQSSQHRTLRHQWTQEPNNCDKQTVISVPMAVRQKKEAAKATKSWQHQTTIRHHQPQTHLRTQTSDGPNTTNSPRQKTLTDKNTDGSSHCKLTIWQDAASATNSWQHQTGLTTASRMSKSGEPPQNQDAASATKLRAPLKTRRKNLQNRKV